MHEIYRKVDTAVESGYTESKACLGWHKYHATIRTTLQIPADYKPWTSNEAHKLTGVPRLARFPDLIDLAWAWRLHSYPTTPELELAKGFYVNLSQSAHTHPWMSEKCMTLCKKSLIYSFEGDFVLQPIDHLAAMGAPQHWQRWLEGRKNPCEAKNMAGEAFAGPCIGTALMAWWLNPHAPWWQ